MNRNFAVSEQIKHSLTHGWPEDLGPSPFDRAKSESGQLFLRFDEIRLENATDPAGGVRVVFVWNGRDTYWMRVEGIKLDSDLPFSTLTLTGIEGRSQMELA